MKRSGFEKRLKRRIIGPEHDFFAICQPGLETLLKKEIEAADIDPGHTRIEKGGVAFQAKLSYVMWLNLSSFCASRIIMRICHFRADNFRALEKQLARIDWILYLKQQALLDFQITARKSRLYHSSAIEQRFRKVIESALSRQDQIQSHSADAGEYRQQKDFYCEQTLFVRADHDRFTVSLDTTGTLLFKRGIKQRVAQAPLRENLAAAILKWTEYKPRDILLDPMCGSGTFSLEAALVKANLAPGLFRSYAFEQWPAFAEKTFDYMKKQAWEHAAPPPDDPEIFAFDLDSTNVAITEKNCLEHAFSSRIRVASQDFFDLEPETLVSRKGVIVLNPPYGKRLENMPYATGLYHAIGKKLKKDFKGWRTGIVVPDTDKARQLGMRLDFKPIFHGGLEIFVGIGVV